MWSEKHRPKTIAEMVGNEEARSTLTEWFAKWKKGTKPLLMVGPPGTGKTTIANLAAKQFGYDLVSLNASDVRNKQNIQEILSPLLGNTTLLGSPMIFVDEVDGIAGRADFGGVEALIKILKEPTIPIILAANFETSSKMKSIKKTVKTIHLKPIPPRMLQLYLQKVLKVENEKLSPGILFKIIKDSKGDIRSLINSAQAHATGFEPLTEKSFESLNVEDGVNAFFKAKTRDEARIVLYSLRIDPREKINAFYSSIITSSISKKDLAEMLGVISKADILYGKILRTQEWRLLRYLDEILLGLYQGESQVRYNQYNLSWPLLNKIRWDGRIIKSLGLFFAKKMHISRSHFVTFYLPTILFCMRNKKLHLDLEDDYQKVLSKEMEMLK